MVQISSVEIDLAFTLMYLSYFMFVLSKHVLFFFRSSVHDAPIVIDSLTAKQVDSGKDQKSAPVKGPFDYSFSYWAR